MNNLRKWLSGLILGASALAGYGQTSQTYATIANPNRFTAANRFYEVNGAFIAGEGGNTTVQSTVTAACVDQTVNHEVIIPADFVTSENIPVLTGCATVYIVDERNKGVPVYYVYSGGAFASVPIVTGGSPINFKGTYSATTTYALNDLVIDAGGIGYISLTGSNINHTPASSGSYWSALGASSVPAVAKAGDTMTGPLILPADPVAALGAATKQYVDNHPATPAGNNLQIQIKNGTVLGATNWSTDSTFQDLLGVRKFSAAVEGGTYHPQAYATTPYVSSDGLTNLLTSANCTTGCYAYVDPNSPSGTSFSARGALPDAVTIDSLYNTGRFHFMYNWGAAGGGTSGPGWALGSQVEWYRNSRVVNEPTHYNKDSSLANNFYHAYFWDDNPGLNYGYGGGSATQNGVYTTQSLLYDVQSHSQGIYSFMTMNVAKQGVGDSNLGFNLYGATANGSEDASGEGVIPVRIQVNNVGTWTNNLAATIGTDWLVHGTATSADQTLGVGRPLIDTQAANTLGITVNSCTGTATPASFNTCTLAAALPAAWVSKCMATTSTIATPESNTGNLRSTMTFTVASTTGLAVGDGFTIVNGTETADLHIPETSVISAINGTTITADFSYSHVTGAEVCFQGIGGGGFVANNAVTSARGLWLWNVIGAPDATHIIVGIPRQGNVDGFTQTGAATLYTGTRILDTRNTATLNTDGGVVRVMGFKPAVAWAVNDAISSPPGTALSQHLIRLNDGNGDPYSDGSFIDFVDSGHVGGIGNGNGWGSFFTVQPGTFSNYVAHGGLDYPKTVWNTQSVNGPFYYGYVPESTPNAGPTLLFVKDYAPGNTQTTVRYDIWAHATTGDRISYTPNTKLLEFSATNNLNLIAGTSVDVYGGQFNAHKPLNTFQGVNMSNDGTFNQGFKLGGVGAGFINIDAFPSNSTTPSDTYGSIYGSSDGSGRFFQLAVGTGANAATGMLTMRVDRATFGNNGADGTGIAAGDICYGNCAAKINMTSGVGTFAAGSTVGGQNPCLANGTNCVAGEHSLHWNIQPGQFATTTALGPVYFERLAGSMNNIVARLSGTTTCSVAPSVVILDLGTSAATAYASGTVLYTLATGTTAGVYVPATFGSSPAIVAGHYIGLGFSAGTCTTAPTFDVTIELN